ncbi:MAG: zinc ribbon domain-containing protein [Burkholderiales bacterium]|nr:zinc ribbon domain-containing protein [Burkholderiales bacterium]
MTTVDEGARSATSPVSATALSSMFQAIGGLRNVRAAAAMLMCFVAGIVIIGLLAAMFGMASSATYFLGALVWFVFFFTGLNAAGILLMDQARGLPARDTKDALLYGLMCIPKVIVLAIGIAIAAIALYIAIAVLLFVCKIPWLGPILFAGVFPLAVVVAGLTGVALFYAFALAICAVWDGASISSAIAKAASILRTRLVETVALSLVNFFVVSFVGTFVASVLFMGFVPAGTMSGAILHVGGMGGGGIASVLMGAGSEAGGGYIIAGIVGTGILWALATTLILLVSLLGLNLIYLRVSEGLDSAATEQALRARLDDAKRKAAEMAQKAKEAGERARAQAQQAVAQQRGAAPAQAPAAPPPPPAPMPPAAPMPAAPAAATAASPASTCPKCAAPVAAGDLFCGNCGHRFG